MPYGGAATSSARGRGRCRRASLTAEGCPSAPPMAEGDGLPPVVDPALEAARERLARRARGPARRVPRGRRGRGGTGSLRLPPRPGAAPARQGSSRTVDPGDCSQRRARSAPPFLFGVSARRAPGSGPFVASAHGKDERCSDPRGLHMARALRLPHLLEIVERADLRGRKMWTPRPRRPRAPSRSSKAPSAFTCFTPTVLEVAQERRSAMDPTWRWDRPEATTM